MFFKSFFGFLKDIFLKIFKTFSKDLLCFASGIKNPKIKYSNILFFLILFLSFGLNSIGIIFFYPFFIIFRNLFNYEYSSETFVNSVSFFFYPLFILLLEYSKITSPLSPYDYNIYPEETYLLQLFLLLLFVPCFYYSSISILKTVDEIYYYYYYFFKYKKTENLRLLKQNIFSSIFIILTAVMFVLIFKYLTVQEFDFSFTFNMLNSHIPIVLPLFSLYVFSKIMFIGRKSGVALSFKFTVATYLSYCIYSIGYMSFLTPYILELLNYFSYFGLFPISSGTVNMIVLCFQIMLIIRIFYLIYDIFCVFIKAFFDENKDLKD